MREILFRGKRLDNGEWVEGCLLYDSEQNEAYIAENFEDKAAYIRKVAPETVGQYTGLKDKNGTEIFEGDIIEHHTQGDIIVDRGVVNWDGESARWAYQLKTMNPCFALYKPDFFEVIGNTHDNPELMGGEYKK